MFLTFPQKYHLFYSTNEMAEVGRSQIIKCQAEASCKCATSSPKLSPGPLQEDNGAAKEAVLRNGPQSHHILS